MQDLVQKPDDRRSRSTVVHSQQHVDTLHEERPIEVRWNAQSSPLKFKEPSLRHLHGLPDGCTVKLVRLAEADVDNDIEDSRVAAERANSFDKSLCVSVQVAVLHLFEQCLERSLVSRHIGPLNGFLIVDNKAYETHP